MGIITIREQEYWLDLRLDDTVAMAWISYRWQDGSNPIARGYALRTDHDNGYKLAFRRCLDDFCRAEDALSRAERRDCWKQFFLRNGRRPTELGSVAVEDWWAIRFMKAVEDATFGDQRDSWVLASNMTN